MAEVIKFTNSSNKGLEILVEPAAEFIDLPPGKSCLIEMTKTTNLYNDPLNIVLENEMLIIYEKRQCEMTIKIDEEIVYYTSFS